MMGAIASKTCKECGQGFSISSEDLEFYEKLGAGEPNCCPSCRQQKRLAFRNERNLYKRKCDMCGKSIVTVYSPDKKFIVYCKDCWWGDKWDAENYGRDFDFSKPFFDQFADLVKVVPRLNLVNVNQENSDFTNYGYANKDCYLIYTSDENEKCYYGSYVWDSLGCLDCLYVLDSKYSYGCVDSVGLYECQYCRMSENCRNCKDCYDCKKCSNCFGCVGLRHKEYYFLNENLGEDEFKKRLQKILSDGELLKKCLTEYNSLIANFPKRATFQVNCQDCFGNYLKNSKNLYWCFDGRGAEDVKWGTNLSTNVHDCYDVDGCAFLEWSAEVISTGLSVNNVFASDHGWNGNFELFYSSYCTGTHDSFGCAGLRKKEFCILNKKYSKEEYEKLREKIVEHMKKTGEWGEFFPIKFSPFAYNETLAGHQYPLSKEDVLSRGWKWKDPDSRDYLPQNKEILACEKCKKNYKIIPQEAEYLQKWQLPVPRFCPDCRHDARDTMRMPRNLWQRKCDKCGVEIWAGYESGGKEKGRAPRATRSLSIVYCEKCYLESL